jgi:hypothetical protein
MSMTSGEGFSQSNGGMGGQGGMDHTGGDNGPGSEAMDMVLDNLGMDESAFEQGSESFESESQDIDQRIEQRQPTYQPEVQRQQPGQQPQRQQPQFQPGQITQDARGNFVGPNGQVVARAGMEARLYTDNVRARAQLAQETHRAQDVTNRLNRAVEIGQELHGRVTQLQEQLRDRNGTGARLGLNDGEQIQALQLAAEAKRDPVATIRKLLTMAATAGVDVSKIGIAPGGVDAKSLVDIVRQEISQVTAPIRQRTEQEQIQQQRTQAAQAQLRQTESEVHGFFNENPGARQYIPIFHAVLSEPQFQNMSLGEVWAKIQLNMMRMNQNKGQQRPNGNSMRRNLPAGRGAPLNYGTNNVAPVNASYDQILRDTLDQLGVV